MFDSGKVGGKKHSLFGSGIRTLKETTGSSLYEGNVLLNFRTEMFNGFF